MNIKNTIKPHSTYNFKPKTVEKIIEKFCMFIDKSPENFEKAIKEDLKNNKIETNIKKLINIARTYKKNLPVLPTFTSTTIIDGYGNLCVIYDGNPYITLKLLISALRTHNNIVFFTNNYFNTNTILIESFNMISKESKYVKNFAKIQRNYFNKEIIKKQNLFDLVIYIGDKRSFQTVQSKLRIPSIFNGYKIVDVYIDDKSFKNILLQIDKYAYYNSIQVNYFDNTKLEDTINYINKYNLNDCFVVFTKNSELAYTFINSLKCKNIFVNKDPFMEYEFDIDENQLVYTKNIITSNY
ncbi:MAG: hypothetical protein IKM97_01430 [Clostridia bacterium]|nr:hypothetical protein [Clostridia bacterium]